jgi:hypothetical protein
VPVTVRDSTYVLDEICNNETELPIREHTRGLFGIRVYVRSDIILHPEHTPCSPSTRAPGLARRRAGKTIRELEQETKVSPTIISRVETGQRPQVSFEVVARLAVALNVSLDRVIAEGMEELEEERQPAAVAVVGA